MSKEVTGFITWIRTFLDDVYAEKGQGGSITLNDVYPIGSIYMSVNSTSPSTLFGGTWVQLTDTFLYATSTTADANVTTAPTGQGEASHTLTTNEMPSHRHKVSSGWQSGIGTDRLDYGQRTGGYNDQGQGGIPFIENTGGGQAHNNMPPYMKVYMWKRTQ